MEQRVVFFGSSEYTIPIVKTLQTHSLRLVVTTEKAGKLVSYLKREQITFITSHLQNTTDIERINKIKPTLGVLASYGAIIPKKVINLFPFGIFNIHPSLLPRYKGPSPIQATILNGERETGVTIIRLDEQIDHGPVVAQIKIALAGKETTEDLKHKLFGIGAEMIEEIVKQIEQDKEIKLTEQDHSKESFTQKITRADGFIDINNPPPPEQLDRMIRAYYSWPTVWFKTPINGKGKLIKLLPNQRIQVEGKRVMTYRDFINGYQKRGEQLLEKLGVLPRASA